MKMDYLDSMINERAILNEKIERLEKEIKKSNFPDGYLAFNRNGDGYKKYQVTRVDGQRVRKYLTSKNKKLIEQAELFLTGKQGELLKQLNLKSGIIL